MSFRLWKTKFPLNRRGLWNVEWNREGEPVHLWTMFEDDLDELRRILGVGMGDCDHCPAWLPYMESLKHQVRGEVISCDMIHLKEQVGDSIQEIDGELKEHEQHFERHDALLDVNSKEIARVNSHLNTMTGAYGKRIGNLETRMDNLDGWGTRLGKRLADVEEDHRALSDEVGELKRSQINTTAYREICERLVKLENDERLEGVESEQDILSQHMVEIDNLIDELKTQVDLMAFIEAYARGRRLLEQDRKDETNKSGIGSNKTT